MSTATNGTTHVASDQRFRNGRECPICGGTDDARRGNGERCFGFLADDGKFCHCTREDHAGRTAFNPVSQTYPHLLKGKCPCGVEHAPADPKPKRTARPKMILDAVYGYEDEAGAVLYQCVRYKDPKDFRQRRPDGAGGWIWNLRDTRLVLFRLPQLLKADPGETVVFVEGEKDVLRLEAQGFITTCNPMGAGKGRRDLVEPLRGRPVAILPDNDEAGRQHAEKIARMLMPIAASVKVVELPGLPEKGDASDWFDQGGTAEDLGHLIYKAPLWTPPAKERAEPRATPVDGKPKIILEHDQPGDGLGRWTDQGLDALKVANNPPTLFQRAGQLVRLRQAEAEGPIEVQALTLDALRGVLDRAANWAEPRVNKKGDQILKWGPPRLDVVRDLAALPGWDSAIIPYIEAIVESPRFLADGRLITTPGYHPDARLYYNPPANLAELVVPPRPTPSQVETAKCLLFDDLFIDFPFSTRASKANALAVTLLPFVRLMIDGPTPLHVFEASTEGTGKGKLANACAYPSLGRDLCSTPQKEDEAEWRKAITTTFMSGASHFYIDNMYNPRGWDDTMLPIDSASLALALTQPYWKDRILGGNTEARIKIQTVNMASGNNLEWSRELTRRICTIRLKTPTENPSERTGFKHDPLEDWIKANHRQLLEACLTLCQAWIAEGRPAGRQTMGSYENYARVMGGILEVIEVPGFLDNRKTLAGKDRESTRWPALIAAWHEARGGMVTSAGHIYDLIFGETDAYGKRVVEGKPDLQVAFAEILGEGKELSQKQKLGRAIAKQEDRVWAGFRIVRSEAQTPNGSVLYKLMPPEDSDDEGEADAFDPDRAF